MIERPKCQVEGCNNEALIVFAGKLVCGDCVVNFYNKEQELKLNILKKLKK